MAVTGGARSAKDATRFTPTTPHASVKPSSTKGSTAFKPSLPSASERGSLPQGAAGGPSIPPRETLEQKVSRLRAAHDAAKYARVSRFDNFLAGSRKFLDAAHKITVMGLVSLTAVAGLATAYTVVDMVRFNSKRKSEFLEVQKRMRADSLEAARLAYMRGEATDEQIAMVEEANAREESGGFQMPSLLGPPSTIKTRPSDVDGSSKTQDKLNTGAAWPRSSEMAGSTVAENKTAESRSTKLWDWFSSRAKTEEESEDLGTSQRRLGYESLSEEDDGSGVRDSDLVRAVEDKQAMLRNKARAAFDKEKDSQRKGGPLDRLGTENANTAPSQPKEAEPKKKGWWLW